MTSALPSPQRRPVQPWLPEQDVPPPPPDWLVQSRTAVLSSEDLPPERAHPCNLPARDLGTLAYQGDPRPIELAGVWYDECQLFSHLDSLREPTARAAFFHSYMTARFRLTQWAEYEVNVRQRLRYSYVQFIHGWGSDSNGHAGAVLKSWVENRFGLAPTFHGGRIPGDPAATERYERDRTRHAAMVPAILMQLDVLYTFAQYELMRRRPGERWLTLYRGTHDPEEYAIRAPSGDAPGPIVRLNNISSFTADREVAWEFGSAVWEVRVPRTKIVCFSGLLPPQLLRGEAEYLVLGGDYRVTPLRY